MKEYLIGLLIFIVFLVVGASIGLIVYTQVGNGTTSPAGLLGWSLASFALYFYTNRPWLLKMAGGAGILFILPLIASAQQ